MKTKMKYKTLIIVLIFTKTILTNGQSLPDIYNKTIDSTIFQIINQQIIKTTNSLEKFKLNYYGYLCAAKIASINNQNNYLIELYSWCLNNSKINFSNYFYNKIQYNQLTSEQKNKLQKIKINHLTQTLNPDSLINSLSAEYYQSQNNELKKLYKQTLDSLLNQTSLISYNPTTVKYLIESKLFFKASKTLEQLTPDSSYWLINKVLSDTALFTSLDSIEQNHLLLQKAHLLLLYGNLNETLTILNKININALTNLEKSFYYQTYTYALYRLKQYKLIYTSLQKWQYTTFQLPNTPIKLSALSNIKNFIEKTGNKLLIKAINDSCNRIKSSIQFNNKTIEKTDSTILDENILLAIEEVNQLIYSSKQETKPSFIQSLTLHYLLESVLITLVILFIVLWIKTKKDLQAKSAVTFSSKNQQNSNVTSPTITQTPEQNQIKKPDKQIASSPNYSDDIHLLLTSLYDENKLLLKKTFKCSYITETISPFTWFFDIRLSKTAQNRGVLLIQYNPEPNKYVNILKAHLLFHKLIIEKGISQPDIILKELTTALSENQLKIICCFINSSFNELLFAGFNYSLYLKRSATIHQLPIAQSAENKLISQLVDLKPSDEIYFIPNINEENKNEIMLISNLLNEQQNSPQLNSPSPIKPENVCLAIKI